MHATLISHINKSSNHLELRVIFTCVSGVRSAAEQEDAVCTAAKCCCCRWW